MIRLRNTAQMQRHFRAMQREGQGMWQFFVVHEHEAPAMAAGALAGEKLALQLLGIIKSTVACLLMPGPAPLCLLCDHEFQRGRGAVLPTAFAGVFALVDDPRGAIVNGLCPACAAIPDPALGDRVLAYYRTYAGMTDLRLVQIADRAGHA